MSESKRLEQNYKKIVKILAEASTCARLKVGALLVKEGRIICTGWNGVPSGEKHCEDIFKNEIEEYKVSIEALNSNKNDEIHLKKYNDFREKHHKFAVNNELHAEQNLIAYCAKVGISMKNATLYITHSPCTQCAKLLVASEIKAVKYIEKYDGDNGLDFLINNNIECIKI